MLKYPTRSAASPGYEGIQADTAAQALFLLDRLKLLKVVLDIDSEKRKTQELIHRPEAASRLKALFQTGISWPGSTAMEKAINGILEMAGRSSTNGTAAWRYQKSFTNSEVSE